jgi:hypothetical protein
MGAFTLPAFHCGLFATQLNSHALYYALPSVLATLFLLVGYRLVCKTLNLTQEIVD